MRKSNATKSMSTHVDTLDPGAFCAAHNLGCSHGRRTCLTTGRGGMPGFRVDDATHVTRMAFTTPVRASIERMRIGRDDRTRGAEPVDGGADDSTGVAGPFAAGIESGDAGAFPGLRVADDPDGRAAPRFGTGERGVPQESTAEPPVQRAAARSAEACDDRLGEKQAQVGRPAASAIARRDLSRGSALPARKSRAH